MRIFTVLFVFVFCLPCFAADDSQPSSTPKNSEDSEEVVEVYIPKDLEDCFRELDKHLRPEDIAKIKNKEIDAIDMHFGLGMSLRNVWGLWGKSRLAVYFNDMGIFHPDDMSGIILDSYVRHVRDEPIRLEEQVAYYKKFWEEAKEAQETQGKSEAQ